MVLGAHIMLWFLEKIPEGQKWQQNNQKWPKNRVFGLFKKITSLVLSGNWCKTKVFIVHWHSAKTACLGKTWFFSCSQKWLSVNGISVFFNHQNFINKIISDFDFWCVDRREWKEQGILMGFVAWANVQFWFQKWCILIALDLLYEFFKNFA